MRRSESGTSTDYGPSPVRPSGRADSLPRRDLKSGSISSRPRGDCAMPARRRSYDAVVRAVERALTAARVDHVFVGGVAVLAFGRARTTEDVDVLADLREKDAPRVVAELRKRGLRVAEW